MVKIAANKETQSLTPTKNAAIIAALFDIEAREIKIARKVVWLQALATLICASLAYGMNDAPQLALAVLSGGMISVVNGAMLVWRMSRSAMHPIQDMHDSRAAHQQLRLLYFSAAERLMVVVALLSLGMVALKLSPLALLGGFVMGQATLVVARLFLNIVKTEILTKNV